MPAVTLLSCQAPEGFEIAAYQGPGGSVVAQDFLAQLNTNNAREFAKLMALLNRVTHKGPPHNEEKCRLLEDGIFEFKTTKARLLWFYDDRRRKVIICTNGYIKKSQKVDQRVLAAAKAAKQAYQQEK